MTDEVKYTFKGYTGPLNTKEYSSFKAPEMSNWKCYLFGNRPNGIGFVYTPSKGAVPNRFVRWMMKVCFDCLWVKDKP